MNIGGLRIGALPDDRRARLLAGARAAALTYDHVGSTLPEHAGSTAAGRVRHLVIGSGPAVFDAARRGLQTWVPQRSIGAAIEPDGQRLQLDATVLIMLRRGPFTVVAPARVVLLVDDPRRFAFAYGTLPGHPERGEESFTIEHRSDDTVRASIRVDASPATTITRAAAPVVRLLQDAAIRGYLRGLAAYVTTQPGHRFC